MTFNPFAAHYIFTGLLKECNIKVEMWTHKSQAIVYVYE
jgi:hypothetical protein